MMTLPCAGLTKKGIGTHTQAYRLMDTYVQAYYIWPSACLLTTNEYPAVAIAAALADAPVTAAAT